MSKVKMYRHGEIGLVKIEKLPEDLKLSESKTIMVGSHGNHHTFDNGKLYLKKEGDYSFGYLVAKNTTLFHPEHGKKGRAKILNGTYQLYKQNEFTPAGLVPIRD